MSTSSEAGFCFSSVRFIMKFAGEIESRVMRTRRDEVDKIECGGDEARQVV